MTSQQRYDRLVRTMSADPAVESTPPGAGRGFGAGSLKVGGKIFAMHVSGRLVVKVPKPRVDALVDSGEGERLETRDGKAMKEWIALAPESTIRWSSLAREALEFVRP